MTDKLKRKAAKHTLFTERKGKIFVHADTIAVHLEWPRIKRWKQSMFQPLNRAMLPDDLTPILELHGAGETAGDDGESDDVLCVIVPGPPAVM